MEQLLRDPIWQFVGVLLSLIALIVAVVAIRVQQQRKSLSYFVSDERPVFYLFNQAMSERLVVTLDGTPVRGLETVEVSIFNDGSLPIIQEDYARPLLIELPASANVLAAGLKETNPPNLGVSIERTDSGFTVSPALLNPGDEFTVEFLLEPESRHVWSRPEVSGRVAGVKELVSRPSRPAPKYKYSYYSFRTAMAAPYLLLGAVISWGASALYGWLTTP